MRFPAPDQLPPQQLFSDLAFAGMDAYTSPNRLPPGFCQSIVNGRLEGGTILSRPGLQGVLATPITGGALYCPTPFLKQDGTVEVLFVDGAGKLRKWIPGSTSSTEILKPAGSGGGSFSFTPSGVRMARHGSSIFIVDGVGPMVRYAGSTGDTVTALNAPSAFTPLASLSNQTMEDTSNPSVWTGIGVFPNGELLLNGSFEVNSDPDGLGSPTAFDNWTRTGQPAGYDSSASEAHPFDGSWCVQFDRAGDSLSQTVNAVQTLSADPLVGATVTCLTYRLEAYVHNADSTSSSSSIVFTLTATDGGGNTLATRQFVSQPEYSSNPDRWAKEVFVASFTDLAIDPATLTLTIAGGPYNNPTADSIYVDRVSLKPVSVRPTVTTGAGGKLDMGVTATVGTTVGDATAEAGFSVGGLILGRTFAGTTGDPLRDFSSAAGVGTVAVALNWPAGVVTPTGTVPQLRLGFRKAAGTVTWTNPLTLSEDLAYAYVDVTGLDDADRQNIKYLLLQVMDDLAPVTPPAVLLSFGPVTNAGELSVGLASYAWRFSERYQNGAGEYILSGGSSYSNELTATGRFALATVDLDASGGTLPVNNGSGGTVTAQEFQIWRRGGAFTDGYARLVATVPAATNATGAGWSWVASTRTFTDNIPDSELLSATLFQENRDPFPSGLTGVYAPEGEARLYAWKGNRLYVSWLLDLSRGESGLYTSLVSDPTDGFVDTQGATFTLSGTTDGDTIQDVKALGSAKAIFRKNGISLLNGYQPSNFAVVTVAQSFGLGTTAPRSCVVDADGRALSYVSPSAILRFDTDVPRDVSLPVRPFIAPAGDDGLPTLTAAGVAGIAQVYHDLRRYTFVPAPGASGGAQTQNTTALVFDYRAGSEDGRAGWTRYTFSVGITSGCSLAFAGLAGSLILAGTDGMLYTLQGETDRATSGGLDAAFTVTITGRAMGQEDAGEGQYAEMIPSRFNAEVAAGGSTTVNCSVTGAVPGAATGVAYSVPTGETNINFRTSSGSRGRALVPAITASVTKRFRLRSWLIRAAQGSIRR